MSNITLTDQVMDRPAPFCPPTDNTWRYPAAPVPEDPRFDAHPDSCPSDLFSVQPNRCTVPGWRFVNKNNPKQMLLFVDGACLGNGTPEARAGSAVCVGPQIVIKDRLGGPQTSNRAELEAAIIGLGLRAWRGEGFSSIVLTTDSEYLVKGFCDYLPKWKRRGWKTSAKKQVANKDLWVALDEKIQSLAKGGAEVLFWWIPRKWNEADKYAKEAADLPPVEESERGPIILMAH